MYLDWSLMNNQMWDMKSALMLVLLWSLVEVHSQTPPAPYLTFMGETLRDHSYVDLSALGEIEVNNNSHVVCHTDLTSCCGGDGVNDRGFWYSPAGTVLPGAAGNGPTTNPIVLMRFLQLVRLIRGTGRDDAPSGLYRCIIETNADNNGPGSPSPGNGIGETLYVGVYSTGGDVTIPDGMTLVVDTDLNGASPQFTLTCISTGGPATTVTWTRDSEIVVGSTVLDNAETATYTHTLIVTGRLGGDYLCTVANVKPSSDFDSFRIQVASAPSNLMAVQEGLTSVRVSWSPPSPLGDTTGYMISYSGGSSGNEIVSGGSTSTRTLTGLTNRASYTISIVGTSLHFDSDSPASVTIQLIPAPDKPAITNSSSSGANIFLSWTESSPEVNSYVVEWQLQGDSSTGRTSLPGSSTSYTITGLRGESNYTITVIAINVAGNATSEPVTQLTGVAESGGPRGGGVNGGAVAAGVIIPLILLALGVGAAVVALWWWRRRSGDSGSGRAPVSHKQPTVQYHKPQQSDAAQPSVQYKPTRSTEAAPAIVRFPQDMTADEGESVLFQVEVTGSPQPKLTWYHNGEEVVADYSRELEEDGSLTMPSAEAKHSGVYQLVAQNPAGRREREVKLSVDTGREKTPSSAPTEGSGHSSPIPVARFGTHVEKNHSRSNKAFRDEYQALYDGEGKSVSIATSSENRLKNRFANICVYDDHHVLLKPLAGHSSYQTDYINASYVDGYSVPNRFLATQGPLPATIVDFWRLVWQERPPSIVMITNLEEGGKIKCQHYWPDAGGQTFGPFQVNITDQQILADYTIRKLTLQLTGSSERAMKVTQFHFTAWPDHGVPDYATPILAFHRRVVKEHRPSKGPLMIHCSAGVGRTGTFITIDHILEQVGREGVVDIPGVINKIRRQRMKLVQTLEQYIFIHDAVLESVTCGDTQIVASNLRVILRKMRDRNQSGKTEFEQQFSILEKVSPNPQETKSVAAQKNARKNRSMAFTPMDRWRVVLKGENPDYISATNVHGYKQQRAFIIAQGPMQSTARDFWKMIHDRKCGVVVMLSDLVEAGKEVCYQYWPSSGSHTYGEFTVEILGEEKLQGFVLRTLRILNTKTDKAHQMTQFHITNWGPDGSCSNIKTVTDVIDDVIKVQMRTGNQPIVIHCSDTVSRSGMFCAITTTIERCKTEGVVDVFQVVKALRVQKPGAVRTVDQYHTIFDAVLIFLDSFDTYANF